MTARWRSHCLRYARSDCALGRSIHNLIDSARDPRLKSVSARVNAVLFLGKIDLCEQKGQGKPQSFIDDPQLHACFSYARQLPLSGNLPTTLLAVHPRSRHDAASIGDLHNLPYHLHIFCDDVLLMGNFSRTLDNQLETYSNCIAKKLFDWLDTELHRGGIRSGTHVNMTKGPNESVVAGVMTGGPKEPLGSIM